MMRVSNDEDLKSQNTGIMKNRLAGKVNNKLRSNAGESLTETLVALLIAALAIVMLAGAVSAASNMVLTARDKLDKYYDANEIVVQMDRDGSSAEITITDKSSLTSKKIAEGDILYYRNDEFKKNPVVAYKLNEAD